MVAWFFLLSLFLLLVVANTSFIIHHSSEAQAQPQPQAEVIQRPHQHHTIPSTLSLSVSCTRLHVSIQRVI